MRGILKWINDLDYGILYEKGFKLVMRHQAASLLIISFMLAGAVFLFTYLEKTKLPPIAKDEALLRIDWNDRINIEENYRRVRLLLTECEDKLIHNTCIIGEQQFLLDHNSPESSSEAIVYIKAKNPASMDSVLGITSQFMKTSFKRTAYQFEDAGNIFDQLFGDDQAPFEIRLRATNDFGLLSNSFLNETVGELQSIFSGYSVKNIVWQEQLVLKANAAMLALYEVTYDQIYIALRQAFRENEILMITDNQNFVPVILGDRPQNIHKILDGLTVLNKRNIAIPLKTMLTEQSGADLKTIIAGQEGEYFPISVDIPAGEVKQAQESVRNVLAGNGRYEAGFSGSYFSNRILIRQLTIIFAISIALLYFILASQFESLTLPLIVLLEIPIDLFGAFLFLKLFGDGINLMSMIGIVVMSGVVINDSILKVDTFNKLMKDGYPLLKALMIGGQRRLKPIVMTALTAILALLPLLFFGGIGTDLQKPMALTIIGGMIVGTLVSLYVVPLFYYYLKK